MPTTTQIAAMEAALQKNNPAMLRDLQALIRIPSVKAPADGPYPFGRPCADALDAALAQAAALGFDTHNLDYYGGWAEMGQGRELLMILAHLDVVPQGDGWTMEPFGAQVADGKLYGRGSQDDKGPALAALYAMRAIQEAGIELKGRVRLFLGCDEESGSSDIEYYLKHAELPTAVFSPDAQYPVVNGEKGILRFQLSATYAEAGAGARVLSAAGGDRPNVVAPTATAVVAGLLPGDVVPVAVAVAQELGVKAAVSPTEGGLRIDVTGVGAHGAAPHKGNNAITALVAILNALPLSPCGQTQALAELKRLLPHGDSAGVAAGLACQDQLSGPLTMNVGQFELDEESFFAVLDVRYPISENHEALFDRMCRRLELLCLYELRDMPPHYVPEDTALVQGLLAAYESVTGREGRCMTIGGGTYARDFAGGVSFGCLFEDSVDNMHQADEYTPLWELELNARILAHAIVNLAAL